MEQCTEVLELFKLSVERSMTYVHYSNLVDCVESGLARSSLVKKSRAGISALLEVAILTTCMYKCTYIYVGKL